jgi:hypothetical protein
MASFACYGTNVGECLAPNHFKASGEQKNLGDVLYHTGLDYAHPFLPRPYVVARCVGEFARRTVAFEAALRCAECGVISKNPDDSQYCVQLSRAFGSRSRELYA